VTIDKQGLDSAVKNAIALAFEDTLKRHHVVLRVEATPDDAQVEVDHRRVGKAPAEVEVVPGKRVVTVSAKGYETVSNYVDVPSTTVGTYLYKIKLAQSSQRAFRVDHIEPEGDIDLMIDRFDNSTNAWNYVIAAGLLVGSAALLTPAIYSAARDGDCFERDENGLCNRHVFGVQSTLLMLGGIVALGGGLAFILFEPIEGDPGVSVQAKPTSIAVTGAF
jgi:hypothetical protein